MTGIASLERAYECGTRSAYIRGCRCPKCREANRERERQRVQLVRAARANVTPSGPPIASTLRRGGRDVRILRCPGVNGAACVVSGAAWLKGQDVCTACVCRAVVWDGLVAPDRARAHLAALSAVGVGYKAVADACDVGATTLCRIISGNPTPIRARIERRILGVDAGAMADGAAVDATETNALLAKMRARGFTQRHLARLLGHRQNATCCQLGKRARCSAATRAHVARLWARIERGEVVPARALIEAPEERAFLDRCFAAGLTERWLSHAIGVSVHRHPTPRMYGKTAEAIRAWRDRMRDELTGGLPEGWSLANASAVADAFSWGGGFSVSLRTKAPRAAKTPEERKAHRRAYLAAWKRTHRDKEEHARKERERSRARRSAMGLEAVRETNRRHRQAKRARDRAAREDVAA